MKKARKQRGESEKEQPGIPRRKRARLRRRRVKAFSFPLPEKDAGLRNLKIGDLYRPLKKPVTLRLDADVIAWFKKDGKRYQTRINEALRKVMEREMKKG
ncbi:MAG: BrnA antitoxin family protein [Candidatus Sulfotelmatobacter sp.]